MHAHGPWTNISYHHLKELAKERLLIKSHNIILMDCIGEGISVSMQVYVEYICSASGRYGRVYKAKLRQDRIVAVKMSGLQVFCSFSEWKHH